jgi:hypothetical protein
LLAHDRHARNRILGSAQGTRPALSFGVARELAAFQYQGHYSDTLDGASMPVWVGGPGDGDRMTLTDWLCREIEVRLPFCGSFASALPLIFGIECSKSHGRALVSVRGAGVDLRTGTDMTLRAVFSRPDEPL